MGKAQLVDQKIPMTINEIGEHSNFFCYLSKRKNFEQKCKDQRRLY